MLYVYFLKWGMEYVHVLQCTISYGINDWKHCYEIVNSEYGEIIPD